LAVLLVVLGCNGLLSGSGSVISDLQAQLFRAVQGNDLATAKRLNDRIYPTARVFYAEPWADMHNRMKEALVLLGRLPRAVVRPPLVKLARAEIERIRDALAEAELLGEESKTRRGVEVSLLKQPLNANGALDPRGSALNDGVGVDEKLSGAGDEACVVGLAARDEAGVELNQRLVPAEGCR
jgi:hypothetical protein